MNRAPANLRITALVVLAVLIDATSGVRGENWPQWRGPERNAVSAESKLPSHWSTESGIHWKVPLAGTGVSSPIIWEDRIVLTATDRRSQEELLIACHARDDGRQLWLTRFWGTAPTLHHATKSDMATPTPLTDGKRIFALFGTGDLFCVDMDGQLVWQRSLAEEYGPFENRFGHTSSPILFENILILQCDHYGASYLLAVDADTGKNIWHLPRPGIWHSWSSPQIVRQAEETTLVVCAAERMEGFDPRNGQRQWIVHGLQRECIPTPVIGHGRIYVVSGPRGSTFAVRPGGSGDVSDSHVDWRFDRGAPYVPSAILVGDQYYLLDDQGVVTCLDAHQGKQLWRHRIGGSFTASPVAGGGYVYFSDDDGVTTVIAAGKKSFTQVARNPLGSPVYASAAISQGKLYFRTPDLLLAIEGTHTDVQSNAAR
jgi:outer membrane protein assembly factor BamB